MKYLSLFTIFVLCFFNFFSYTLFVQASSFYISSQKVSLDTSDFTNQQDELNVLPNQLFRLESYVQNDTGNPISGITYYTNFTNGILYQQETPRAFPAKDGSFIQGSISLDEFNPNSIPNYYNSVTLENSSTYQMRRILLKFPENWSTYENTLSNHFTASGGYTSDTKQTKIYVNVVPHIIDYYFEKSDGSQTINQVQGNDSEPINLVLKVKDYNLCSNISAGTITANLSQLGLGANESLSYDSCEADGKTAVFKKTGITTSVDLGSYSFNNTYFTAIDSDGNQNNPSDTRFGTEDKTSSISIEVVPSLTPVIDFISLTENLIGGPDKQTSELTVNSTYSGNIQAKIGSDTNCNGGTVIEGITTYTENTNKSFTINTSDLSEGINNIYVCLEKDGYIGSLSREIRLDETAPTITNPSYTVNVGLNDSNITFSCSEDGYFAGELRGTSTLGTGVGALNWTSTTAGTINTYTALNSNLLTGPNEFHIFCRDNATNISYKTGSITKTIPVLSMNGLVDSLTDNDFDNEGLDGRDISIVWQKPAGDISNFYSYQLYILPSNITFDVGTHGNNHITYIQNPDTTNFTGVSTITKDSTNTNLVSGTSYKACITIMGTSGQLGTESCSPASILTADTVEHATVTSAKFTSDTNLELTTDTTLDTDLSSHSGALISYVYNSNTINPTGVASVDGTKINLTIPSLNNLGATGNDIIVSTGALRSSVGGYNNHHTFATITDGQNPSITGFANNTASIHNSFFSGSINVGFSFAETMRANGYTKITFDRTAGNTSTQKSFPITDPAKLANGAHTQNIDLSSILVSGTSYDMKLVGQDLAGNSVTSSAITVKFDNIGSTTPTLNDAPNTSSQTPTLSWNASIDDSGNGSGVKEYTIKIYNSADCSGGASQILTSTTTSKATNTLSNGTYSWNVVAVDNMNNIGTTSSCDSFIVDTSIPTISNLKITDTTNSNSTSHTKSGNTLQITADLTNTEISKIKADLSALTGNASHTGIVCDSPLAGITCSYNAGLVTYGFNVGFAGIVQELVRQIKLIVSNPSEVTTVEQFSSITVDNTAPTGGNITGPTGTIGGNENQITFTNISDSNLANVEIGYVLSGTYTQLTNANALVSPYTWDTTSLAGGDYQIRLTATDRSGNQTIKESATFTLDKSAPTIAEGVFTNITSGQYIKGNTSFSITWNNANITDTGGLVANPITLEYSTNNGTNWSTISSNLPNSGTYSWNISSINGTQTKLRIKAIDSVGNESAYVESETFIIDSSLPTIIFGEGTPPNGAYINDTGFDIIASLSDNISLDTVSYSFKRISDNNYWNGTSWTGSEVYSTITGSINSINYNINDLIQADLVDGITYDFTLKVTDKAGNEKLSTTRQYVSDLTDPTLNITTSSGTYFSGSLNIAGTSSDTGAGISNISISIKKGSEYWNGSSWVVEEQKLLTSSANNYANWSYDFTPLSGDTDGQNYEVIVYAYDKSYKVNNSNSGSINIILDKTGPVIQDGVFTFDTSLIYAGGDSLNITWNTGSIIDEHSGLGTNPIKLEYIINGSGSTVIAENLANNGTYDWTTAPIDNNVIIRLTATDNVGNTSYKNSNSFTIDSTPPTITGIETRGDTYGNISGFLVRFSEIIKNPGTLVITDIFSSSTGTLNNTIKNTTQENKTVLELNFETPISGTDLIPTLSWNGDIIEDLAGKKLAAGSIVSIDNADPVIINSEVFDTDSNGKLDKIEVTFSENLVSTTDTSAWSLNNAFAGISINSVNISGDTANITLTEGTNFDTSIGTMSLNFNSNSNYKDSSNNQAGSKSNIELIDKANPIILSAEYIDSDINYKADKVNITLSENVVGFDINDFSIAGLTKNNGSISNNIITINLTETVEDNDTAIIANFDYTNNSNLKDSSNNFVNTVNSFSITDKIAPKLLKEETIDSNSNGQIDTVRLTFSEDIGSDFSSFTTEVDGYNLKASPYSKNGNTIVEISLVEKTSSDTGATPQFRIVSNSSLKDNSGNNIKTTTLSNLTDSVGPVIIGARFDESSQNLYVNFSETVSGSLNNSSFSLLGASSNINSTTFNTGESTAIINLTGTGITYGSSEISFNPNTAGDSLGNKQSGTRYTKISASVIINEIKNNGDVKYIELKNISSASVNIGDWIIENALGNGSHYTIPTGQNIAENGYYLISTDNTSFSGVTANQTASLNISTNLILKNGTITVDSTVYQAGDNNISFERKSSIGDGLDTSNWYKAQGSVGFTTTTPKGTPGSNNIFDATAPTINSHFPSENSLLPMGVFDLSFNYLDDEFGLGVNSSSDTIALYKWNGSNWGSDISASKLGTKQITSNKATYPTNNLEFGKYKANFSIKDLAGNTVTKEIIFYIDELEFIIDKNSLDIGELKFGNNNISSGEITITIKTLGAGFDLNMNKQGLLSAGLGLDIIDWNSSRGFGYDIEKNQTVNNTATTTTKTYSNSISKITGSDIGNIIGVINENGEKNVYTYKLKYGANIDIIQAAGIYQVDNNFKININY